MQRMSSSAFGFRHLGAAIPMLGLIVFLSTGPSTRLAAQESKDKSAPGQDLKQKLKGLEEEAQKLRQEMLKEAEGSLKKAEETIKKAQEDVDKARKDKNKEASNKAQEAMKKAQEEQGKARSARMDIQMQISRFSMGSAFHHHKPSEEDRMGIHTSNPSPLIASHLGLAKEKGMVLERVDKNSAAEKAGLQAHDILIQLNGKDVPSDKGEYRKLLSEIKPDAEFEAVVLRQGKQQTVKGLTVPTTKPAGERRPEKKEKPKAEPEKKPAGTQAPG